MLDALRNALSEENISMLQLPSASQRPEQILEQARASRADAFILVGCFSNEILRLLLDEFPGRIVLLDHCSRDLSVDAVIQDNEIGGYQALSAFCPPDRGAEIAVVRGADAQPVTDERMGGVCKVRKRNPLLNVHEYPGDYTLNSGALAIRTILDEGLNIDGIFCMNDEMALGVLSVVNERKLVLPDSFWLLGYDDVLLASAVNLSTIRFPVDDMVQSAVELFMRRIQHPDASKIVQSFAPQVIWRKTAVPFVP